MTFTKKSANLIPIEDTVFTVVKLAKEAKQKYGKDNVVDATIGSLYGEDGTIVAYKTVFDSYDHIDKSAKAAYATSFVGNDDYRTQVYEWVTEGKTNALSHSVLATIGGSGAVSLTFQNILDAGQTVILPDIAWGSYTLMAQDKGLNYVTYSMFDGDNFNLTSFKETCLKVMETQDKLLVVINDPCHNPTGYSMSNEEWKSVISFLNECSKKVPCVILNDIAYIDYSYHLNSSRDYLKEMNHLSDNVMVIVAFSCSKTLTSYGLRCGAAIIMAKSQEKVREVEIAFEKSARSTWSNVPNAAMNNFVYVTKTIVSSFMEEKQQYVDLLEERSSIFLQEAKACGLPIYPYKEGFFITIQVEDKTLKEAYHQALMKNNIFTVIVNKGIRVALCSVSVEKTKGLALKMNTILKTIS